jgi:hypothetical protein
MFFMAFGKLMLIMLAFELAICWDMMVLAVMGPFWAIWAIYVWPVKGGIALYRRRRGRETQPA